MSDKTITLTEDEAKLVWWAVANAQYELDYALKTGSWVNHPSYREEAIQDTHSLESALRKLGDK